jgi:type III restriction enzyme
MPDVLIENPVLNSPFKEPTRHFKFAEDGITNEIVESRRISSYFVPVPPPKKRGRQLSLGTEWTKDRIEENLFINQVRGRVAIWRKGGYQGITKTTRRLLDYWRNPERDKKLFFCQVEALETAIYLAEVAGRYGDAWIENSLRTAAADANPLLYRVALKMATGSGKTVVMAMLIAWQVLNKLANPQDARFTDAFLIVTPGITIRDRLRVLWPNDPDNYYRQRDVVSSEDLQRLAAAKIIITNFHTFKPREKFEGGALTKSIATQGLDAGATKETPGEMVRRVCREFGNKRNIIVINDEAHHCYRRRVGEEGEALKGDERREAENRNEEARVWISGLEAVKEKMGVKVVYDLSATPFFLRGSGYSEGTLFPWVVSDFSLIDAIESGIVKVPRVPVADDQMAGDLPTYRNIWLRIRDDLPKKGRGKDPIRGEPVLPKELEGALQSLYSNYQMGFRQWEAHEQGTPPVFIVVCNNTNVSKMVYDYVAGWGKPLPNGEPFVVPGKLDIFSNEQNGKWRARPNTLLIDSEQLESGEALSPEFRRTAAVEIEQFKSEYRLRTGREPDDLTDADILREVMNTVGKSGRLGEHLRCVISVSMLSEGWDANTVTHILGVRAFGTQLLCEQVVGRGLRRVSYVPKDDGMFEPEYAEVYGVPFSFIPCSGSNPDPRPGPTPRRVRALPERAAKEITFPRLDGYRFDFQGEHLPANFTADSRMVLSTADVPTMTENAPIVGQSIILTLEELEERRLQEVAFVLARLVLERYFRQDGKQEPDGNSQHAFIADVKHWLFPEVLDIRKRWLNECVTCKDGTFPQLLLFVQNAHNAADKIYRSIVGSVQGEKRLMPRPKPYDTIGSSQYVDFDTTKPVYLTRPEKCHVNYVVADTESWEQKMAQALEDMAEVESYVKNQGLGFRIPYTINGVERSYEPDFILRIRDRDGEMVNLIVEVTGARKQDKEAKVETAKTLWVPAVNNHGGFGRWAYLEVLDPWDAKNLIRAFLASLPSAVPV